VCSKLNRHVQMKVADRGLNDSDEYEDLYDLYRTNKAHEQQFRSEIRSHIEYSIQSDNISVLVWHLKLTKTSNLIGRL